MLSFRGRKGATRLENYAAAVEQILPILEVDPATARLPTDQGYG